MIDVPESIKQLYIEGLAPKRVQIIFPNGEHTAIGNEHIVAESLEFRENLSQGDTFKFGICEASMIKFDAYDIPNLKGFRIMVFHGIYSEDLGWYDIPLGVFDVTEQKIDKKTGKNTVTGYSQSIQENSALSFEKFRTQNMVHFNAVDTVFNMDILAMEIGAEVPSGATVETTKGMVRALDFGFKEDLSAEISVVYYAYQCPFWTANLGYRFNTPSTNTYCFHEKEKTNAYEASVKKLGEHGFKLPNIKYGQIVREYIGSEIKDSQHIVADIEYGRFYPLGVDGEYFITPKTNTSYQRFEFVFIPSEVVVNGVSMGVIYEDSYTSESPDVAEHATVPLNFFKYTIDVNQRMKLPEFNQYFFSANATQIKELDFAKMLISYFEVQGKILRYNRNGGFVLVDVQQTTPANIYPSYNIYPSNNLYPEDDSGVIGRYFKNNYSEVDVDSSEIDGIGTVAVKYKCSDPNDPNNGKEVLYKYKASDSKSVYQMDDNFFCLKYNEYDGGEGIRAYSAEDFARNIGEQSKDIKYTPFTLNAQALPWVEVGDTVRINTPNGMVNSIVFSRTIKGIQALSDELSAPAINTEGLYIADSSITEG